MRGDKKLIKYIREQISKGYTRAEIETHLIKNGHNRDFVERNFEIAIEPKTDAIRRAVEFTCIIALAAFIFWIGFSSEAPFGSVIAGFLPAIFSLIFLISVTETKRHVEYMWIMPLIFSIVFLVLGLVQAPLFDKMEIGKLTFLNIVISYIFLLLISYPEAYKKAEHDQEKQKEKDIKHQFHSIEGKCKAINFVIGRVYRSSNGGTTSLRDKIRISSELYNEFQRLLKEGTREEIIVVLDKIGKALFQLNKPEKEIFGPRATGFLKNILRDDEGNDNIISVLAKNDNDPVVSYYEEALESYNDLRKKVEHMPI